MIDTVIFDVGGTLVDAPDLFLSLSELFPDDRRKGQIQSKLRESVLGNYQRAANGEIGYMSIETIVANALQSIAAEFDVEDHSASARAALYRVFLDHARPVAGLHAVLEHCQRNNIEMYIASDADIPLLYLELEKLGIRGYFRECFVSDEIKAYKPSDDFIEAIRGSLSPHREAIFVGDTDADIRSGEKLGIKTVYLGRNEPRAKPTYRISTLLELVDLLGFG